MKQKLFDASYLSAFCMELYLITKAGIPFDEGVRLLWEDEQDSGNKQILELLYQHLEIGEPFAASMRAAGGFPFYVIEMVEIGEQTGHLESVFHALAEYYERMDQLKKSIRSAILYPSVLLAMMMFVILVLLIKVLPIFQSVFLQLGAELSPMALAFMKVGQILGRYGLGVLAVVGMIVLLGAVWLHNPERRTVAGDRLLKAVETTKFGKQLASSRMADALEMALASGLDIDRSLDMAQKLVPGSYTEERIRQCKRSMLLENMAFAEAAQAAGLFAPVHCRMISAGFRAGAVDTVMHEVARRCGDDLDDTIESMLSKVEPTLVVILSLAVGMILLSVMLPLMSIMTAIG